MIAAAALYAGLVVVLSWPLAPHLGTHLPNTWWTCQFDPLYTAWALASESHALATAPTRLLEGNVFYPTPHVLRTSSGSRCAASRSTSRLAP